MTRPAAMKALQAALRRAASVASRWAGEAAVWLARQAARGLW